MRKLMIAVVTAFAVGALALACEQAERAVDAEPGGEAGAGVATARDTEVTPLEDIAPGFELEADARGGATAADSLDPLGPRRASDTRGPDAVERGRPGGDSGGRAIELRDAGLRDATLPETDRRTMASPARAQDPEAGSTSDPGAGNTSDAGVGSTSDPAAGSTSDPGAAAPARTERVNFTLDEIQGRRAETARTAGGVVPAGSVVSVRLDQQLSTSANEEGDPFTATTTQPLLDDLGRVALPAGSVVRGRVLGVDGADADGETSMLVLGFESISGGGHTYALSGTVVDARPERRKRTATRGTAAKVGAGAAAGAILGQILGKDTESTLIGAAAGAAAGTAIALGTRDVEAVLPAGSVMAIRLDTPLRVATR